MSYGLKVIGVVFGIALLLESINNMGIANTLILFALFSVAIIICNIVDKIKEKKHLE